MFKWRWLANKTAQKYVYSCLKGCFSAWKPVGDAKRLVLGSCEEFRSAEAGKTKFGFWRQITTSSLEDFLGNQKLKEPYSCKTTKVIMSKRSKDADADQSASKKTKQAKLNFGKKGAAENQDDEDEKASPGISFKDFCLLCKELAGESSYNSKTNIIQRFVNEKTKKSEFQGDLFILVKTLLPGIQKRVYNLKDKQIVKLFSQVFAVSCDDMVTDLEQGNVSETVKDFFKQSQGVKPSTKSTLTLIEVDGLLDELALLTKEDEQLRVLKKIAKRCTTTDLKFIVRLIKHDLRMNTGAKHVLDALDKNAYAAYQACSNLKDVVEKLNKNKNAAVPGLKKSLSIRASLMTPVKPMLAEACKSTAAAMKKCPNGMYSEIKYDGERVQIHKQGNKFDYFSRSLKAVQPHKVAEIKDYIPKACPEGDSLILDGEVLLVDNETGKFLPFGTLGIHKKAKFKSATVCYVIFDILQFNDENLMKRPIMERRDLLVKNVKEIKGHIMLSEMTHVTKEQQLKKMLDDVFAKNLEGLVLKDLKSIYEPGKRHWLKMKKDYLHDGAMADSADLVVLGAYYGTGNKGGLMSVFLMGCYNPVMKKWVTVAKCGNGHDDSMIAKLQDELAVNKISKDSTKIPSWLDISKTLVPDFVVKDPKTAPVWEISGAEFSQSSTHTADGISIRFPRVTRIRDDKDWKTATDLPTLQKLFDNSKTTTDNDPQPGPSNVNNNNNDHDGDDDDDVNMADVDNDQDVESKQKSAPKKTGKASKDPPKAKSPKKRKVQSDDEDANESPKKKSKPNCKYGTNCYQKNKDHLEKYSHEAAATSSSSTSKSKQSLSNMFNQTKIFIADDVEDSRKMKRYIIAFDGDVVDEYHLDEATHYVTRDKDKVPDGLEAMTVSPEWIWESLKKESIEDESKFLI